MKISDKDILKETSELKQMPFSTPEGYFEGLKKELKTIPAQHSAPKQTRIWIRPVRYSTIAAIFATLIAAGAFFLDWSDRSDYFTEEDYIVFSDDMTNAIFQEYSDMYADAEAVTEDDFIEYLIYSGIEIEDIEQY